MLVAFLIVEIKCDDCNVGLLHLTIEAFVEGRYRGRRMKQLVTGHPQSGSRAECWCPANFLLFI